MNVDPTGHIAANVIGAVVGGIIGAVGGYFLAKWLAGKLKLSGWKRKLFIGGLTALITASAAAIGYFLGPYVAKVGKSLLKSIKSMVKSSLKKPSCCFVAGTLIKTKNGMKPIEEIQCGDYVYSRNPDTGEEGLKKVLNVFVKQTDTIVTIETGDEIIETTETHPFWVKDKGWVEAKDLTVTDILLIEGGASEVIKKVTITVLDTPITVYNFEVEDWHTYFITDNCILVHNANCGNELQQFKEACRKLKVDYKKASKYLHKWKNKNGMSAGDHLSWKELLDVVMEFKGL